MTLLLCLALLWQVLISGRAFVSKQFVVSIEPCYVYWEWVYKLHFCFVFSLAFMSFCLGIGKLIGLIVLLIFQASDIFLKDRSVSLGIDHPSKPQPSNFFLSPQVRKNFSPLKETKSPDNSNIFHMFNNTSYTDFRTASKHFLIPSYIIRVI